MEWLHGSPHMVTRKSSFTTSDLKSLSCPWRDIKLKIPKHLAGDVQPWTHVTGITASFLSPIPTPPPHSLLGINHNNVVQNRQLGPHGSEAQGVISSSGAGPVATHTASF